LLDETYEKAYKIAKKVNKDLLLKLNTEDKYYIRTQYDTDYVKLTLKELVKRVNETVEIIYESTTFEEEIIVEY